MSDRFEGEETGLFQPSMKWLGASFLIALVIAGFLGAVTNIILLETIGSRVVLVELSFGGGVAFVAFAMIFFRLGYPDLKKWYRREFDG